MDKDLFNTLVNGVSEQKKKNKIKEKWDLFRLNLRVKPVISILILSNFLAYIINKVIYLGGLYFFYKLIF